MHFSIPKGKGKILLIAWGQILLGCVIGGAAYPLFLVPNSIAPGGLTGAATILNYLIGVPVGTASLVMNIPLFIAGYRYMGRIFALRSLAAMILFSVLIDLLCFQPVTVDPLLASIYGGVLLGIGLGLIMRGGATTGGTDMMAGMVHRQFPSISVGAFLFALDCIVVMAAGVAFGANEALYALICIYVSSKVIDTVVAGFVANKACFIITDHWEQVTERIIKEMERGATLLTAKGAYSGKERPVVLCVVARQEVSVLKDIVRREDDKAFVFITEAREALGEGFTELNAKD